MRFWLALTLALAFALPSRAAPLEAYGKQPAVEVAVLSPSGKQAAVVSRVGDVRLVSVNPVGGPVTYNAQIGSIPVENLSWAGEHYLILITRQTIKSAISNLPLQSWPVAIAIDLNTGKSRQLLKGSRTTIETIFGWFGAREVGGVWYGFVGAMPLEKAKNPDGGVFYPDLYRVDLGTGVSGLVAKAGGGRGDWQLDLQGKIVGRTRQENDGSKQRVYVGRDISDPALEISATNGSVRVAGLGRTADSFLVMRSEKSQRDLIEFRPGGPASGEVIVSSSSGIDPFFDPSSELLTGYGLAKDGTSTFFDPVMQRRHAAILKAFPGRRVTLSSMGSQLEQAIVYTESASEPGRYWFIDLPKKSADLIADTRPDIPQEDVGMAEARTLRDASGQSYEGILTLPPGRPAKRLPLVVYLQDDPRFPPNPLSYSWNAQAVASRGYAVWQPRLRLEGSEALELYGKKPQLAVAAAIGLLDKDGLIDPARVCVFGAEMGGHQAIVSASEMPGSFRCVAALGAVSELSWIAADINELNQNNDLNRNALLRSMGLMGTVAELKQMSVPGRVKPGSPPVLLIHAADDVSIPIRHSRSAEAALKAAKVDVQFVALAKADHDLSQEAPRIQMLNALVIFLEKHNPP